MIFYRIEIAEAKLSACKLVMAKLLEQIKKEAEHNYYKNMELLNEKES